MPERMPLRPQQVHVPLTRRLRLYAEVKLWRIKMRYHAWKDFTPGDGYVDGYCHGFNRISGMYDELAAAASQVVWGKDSAENVATLREVMERQHDERLGPPADHELGRARRDKHWRRLASCRCGLAPRRGWR